MTIKERKTTVYLLTAALLAAVSYALLTFFHTSLPSYISPLFWLALSILVWLCPRTRHSAKLRLQPFLILLVLLTAVVSLVSTFAAGFLGKMGRTPYSQTPFGILRNLLLYASVPVMMEWVRAYLINGVERNRKKWFALATAAVYALLQVNLLKIGSIHDLEGLASYLGADVLSVLVLNGYLSYVAYLAGPIPGMLYMVVTTVPQYILPVLPDLNWLIQAIIGCVVPLFSLLILQDVYSKSAKLAKPERKKENPYSWIAVLVGGVLVVWFAAGLFPVYPVTIMSGSMEPLVYPGDVVMMQRISAADVKKGDIVQYQTPEMAIVHRVIGTDTEDGKTVYITKGDNNNVRDPKPVSAEQIKGKVVGTIPKVGMLTFLLRSR